MALIIWKDVESLSPSLSAVDDAAQFDILDHVNTTLVADEFGGEESAKYRLARMYLAAHFGTISLRGADGASGPVTSESAGPLSRSYADNTIVTGSNPEYGATPFGTQYLAILKTTAARAPIQI